MFFIFLGANLNEKMETYLKSHIQGTKYILEHNLQDFKGKNNPFNIILK